jgi:hypothetical protein
VNEVVLINLLCYVSMVFTKCDILPVLIDYTFTGFTYDVSRVDNSNRSIASTLIIISNF